ncbi:DUF86 domain-containing protein [Tessaracoccus sp. OS52]|uniref:HepT-like ribonuclease domain-containing protein n=1 Tax=Tessaracoccus sp. OS52 TaxID=2886691 RepID=UPI001D115BFF|nr:HepT-like ribonuclease domain-containing protein [Tessaracoccus sp. OS52]MCC2591878.1 DUF86 domain-containing protein [Tessaracoccus sp. OS52]
MKDALLHLDFIDRYATMDLGQDVVVDAIALRLASMIDALNGLPSVLLEDLFGEDWPAMRGLRNRIAHGYHLVAADVLRVTVTQELPAVRESLGRRLSDIG